MKLKNTRSSVNAGEQQHPANDWRRKSHSFLESAPDPTVIVNKAGRIAAVNNLAEDVFGYDKRELLGKSLELLIPLVHKKIKNNESRPFFTEPRHCRIHADSELYAVRKDGHKFIVDVS